MKTTLTDKETRRVSKFLSLVLRHQPELIKLNMDANGWVEVEELINKVNTKGFRLDREKLDFVVATNNKKRFAFSDDGDYIRASQGHSLEVDLGLKPVVPPTHLYHGTALSNIASIRKGGLVKRSRQHVHLSAEIKTAMNVGGRHGKPHLLILPAREMQEKGFEFFLSKNGVWLTDHVPAEWIDFNGA